MFYLRVILWGDIRLVTLKGQKVKKGFKQTQRCEFIIHKGLRVKLKIECRNFLYHIKFVSLFQCFRLRLAHTLFVHIAREILRIWSIEPNDSSEIFHDAFFLVSNKARKEQLQIDLKPDCSSLGKVYCVYTRNPPVKLSLPLICIFSFHLRVAESLYFLQQLHPIQKGRKRKVKREKKNRGKTKQALGESTKTSLVECSTVILTEKEVLTLAFSVFQPSLRRILSQVISIVSFPLWINSWSLTAKQINNERLIHSIVQTLFRYACEHTRHFGTGI